MKKLYIFIAILFILAVIIGGWWYFNKSGILYRKENTKADVMGKKPAFQVSSWTSYSVNEFDFKYPANWPGPGFTYPSVSYTLSGFIPVDNRVIEVKIAMTIVDGSFQSWKEGAEGFKNDGPITVDGVEGVYYINFEASPGTHTYLFPYKDKVLKIAVTDLLELNLEQLEQYGATDLEAVGKVNSLLNEIVLSISWNN